MCNWVTMLYSIKLTEHYNPAIMEKNENHYIKPKKSHPPNKMRMTLETTSQNCLED